MSFNLEDTMKTRESFAGAVFCPYCGQEFASANSFCPYCGNEIALEKADKDFIRVVHESFCSSRKKILPIPQIRVKHSSFGNPSCFSIESANNERFELIQRQYLLFLKLLERAPENDEYSNLCEIAEYLLSLPAIKKGYGSLTLQEQIQICCCLSFLISCHIILNEHPTKREEYMADIEILSADIVSLQKLCVNREELFALEEFGDAIRDWLNYNPYGSGNTVEKNESSSPEQYYDPDILNEIQSLEKEMGDHIPNFKCHRYNLTTNYWDELEKLIGLSLVKGQLCKQINNYKLQLKRKELHPDLEVIPSFHCIFKGKPGTGKTTVARLVAGILREEGMLEKGCCVEVNASELISGWVGFSAKNAKLAVLKAMDGVLFIDEAYALMNSKGSKSSPGEEVIDTLTPLMENYRGRIVIILAGYNEEMDEFLSHANTGFPSRFKAVIQFEDYNAVEMFDIFYSLVRKYGYKVGPDALRRAAVLFSYISQKKDCIPTFANARTIRTVFELIMERAAQRIIKSEHEDVDLDTLTVDDISLSRSELKVALGIV